MSLISIFDKDGTVSLDGLINVIQAADAPTSLTGFAKKSMVNSRVYIEKNLANDEILNPLMQSLMSLYCGLVFTAVNLNQNITGCKRVQDYSSPVASAEAFNELSKNNSFQSTMSLMKDYFVGTNSDLQLNRPFMAANSSSGSRSSGDIYRAGDGNGSVVQNSNNVFDSRNQSTKIDLKAPSVVETETRNVSLPTGRILNIPMMTDAKSTINLQLLVQLFPFFVESDVAQAFIDLNFTPSFRRRLEQFGAGEISFFKDFLFSCDLRQKRMKALIHDKSGGLRDMINRQKNAVADHWLNFIRKPGTEKVNIANTILIFNKNTISKAANRLGINFSNVSNRRRFFEKSYCMMLVLVDQMYNEVTIYYNGLEAVSIFKYDQIKRESKKDSTDLVSIMKSYAQGLAPKF